MASEPRVQKRRGWRWRGGLLIGAVLCLLVALWVARRETVSRSPLPSAVAAQRLHRAEPLPLAPDQGGDVFSRAGDGGLTLAAAPSPGGALWGQVVSARDGSGVARADVTLSSEQGASSVTTDDAGHFRFAPPGPGTFQVASVVARGFLPFGPEWGHSPLSVTTTAGKELRGLVVTLQPSSRLTVEVVDDHSAPVPAAQVRLLTSRTDELALFPIQTHFTADGRGLLLLEAPADSVVEAWDERRGRGLASVNERVLDSGRLTVQLEPWRKGAAALTGRVVDAAGNALAGATVWARSALADYPKVYGDRDGYRVRTDAEGRFAFSDLEPGRYDVSGHSPGLSADRREGVAVPAAGLLLSLSRGARVVGTVTDAGGQPLQSFVLELSWLRGPLERSLLEERAFVSPEGRYLLEGVPPGEHVLVARSPGLLPAEARITLKPETGELRVDLALAPGATLRGQVVSTVDGSPLEGARVVEERLAAPSWHAHPGATTDAQGRFALDAVPRGKVAVRVSARGHRTRLVSDALADTALRVALTPLSPDGGGSFEMVGIGAELRARNDALVIGSVAPKGGAAAAGLGPGDEIVAVDGTPVVQLGFGGAIQAIRGHAGTRVTLHVRRAAGTGEQSVAVQRGVLGV